MKTAMLSISTLFLFGIMGCGGEEIDEDSLRTASGASKINLTDCLAEAEKSESRDAVCNQKGLCYFKAENYAAALKEFKTARYINPDEIVYWYNKALSECKLGEYLDGCWTMRSGWESFVEVMSDEDFKTLSFEECRARSEIQKPGLLKVKSYTDKIRASCNCQQFSKYFGEEDWPEHYLTWHTVW